MVGAGGLDYWAVDTRVATESALGESSAGRANPERVMRSGFLFFCKKNNPSVALAKEGL